MPGDDALLDAVVRGTEALNKRYPGNRFSLFYRTRTWDDSEQTWMGWERKRGKLEELNRWLVELAGVQTDRSDKQSPSTLHHVGDKTCLAGTRFVLTLDADTQLPRDTARRLVGTLAHPLNRPIVGPNGQTVMRGYAIIQPRVSTSLPSVTATRFSRLVAGTAGTDPYTGASSDVYQDLFGEGSYHGKAIYDLRIFHRLLDRRFPQDTLLSHDLVEGAYLRVGLASDIELFDQFPSTYRAFAAREHRWIRGDWQVADWCTPRVPGPDGSRVPNPLSAINRWKIFDNLRRSLVAPSSVFVLIVGWLFQPEFATVWSTLIGVVLALPTTIGLIDWLTTRVSKRAWMSFLGEGRREVASAAGSATLSVILVPHQAVAAIDAIVRVLYRRLVSRRHLLEWQSSRTVHRLAADRDREYRRQMIWVSVVATIPVAVALALRAPAVFIAAGPYLVAWEIAPYVVVWLNQGRRKRTIDLMSSPDRQFLRRIARQTWRYFDDLVGPQTNWLPPDNYQVALRVEVAPRTSPTNIGLWLLSAVAANDFGYLTGDQVVERSLATFDSISKLERFRGHILNWYNVQTLLPLQPRYVSSVDSGNLLAALWALDRSYDDLATRPIIRPAALHGLGDTLDLVVSSLVSEPSEQRPRPEVTVISDLTARLAELFSNAPEGVEAIVRRLRSAAVHTRSLSDLLQTRGTEGVAQSDLLRRRPVPVDEVSTSAAEMAYWAAQLDRQVLSWLELVDRFLPWLAAEHWAPEPISPGVSRPMAPRLPLAPAPTLRELASDEPLLAFVIPLGREPAEQPSVLTASDADHASEHRARSREAARELLDRLNRLKAAMDDLASDLDLEFLYDVPRRLFSTGYNVEAGRLDSSHYDLLASEARLASFVAIARGDVPVDHWLTLGRPYGLVEGRPALLSWSGTMFEYLMPLLLTRLYDRSLLSAACLQAVSGQIAYGNRLGLPWGISEAAFAAVDVHQIYQYQAFGVPSLGLKRGLDEDLVIAPYATALALLVQPFAAIRNLKRLVREGAAGAYGYFDSIDYTPTRQAEGGKRILVATYMAHHAAMTF
ncbi:MAG TPA: glucoamylase family protein, partial [Chloroflexota bacterium]|nr:glucoamylase family protein [Chloroflexota bacterium]